jgi:hypothetical protein
MKQKRWGWLTAGLLFAATLGCIACENPAGPSIEPPETDIVYDDDTGDKTATIHVTGLSLNTSGFSLVPEGTATLIPSVSPANASNKSVTWTSSDTSVVTVDSSGVIKALADGTANITVTSADGKLTIICIIIVIMPGPGDVPVTGVSLNANSLSLMVGGTAALAASVEPGNATNKGVTWSSSNTAVATVDSSGVVTAIAGGHANITVTTNDGGKTATCAVTVESLPAANASIEMVSIGGGTFQMGQDGVATPVHSVTVGSFLMGKYVVTQEQYLAVMGSNPSYFNGQPGPGEYWEIRDTPMGEAQGKRPVEKVSWYDAIVFCNKLSIKEGLTPVYSISGSTNPNTWGTVPEDINSIWNAVTWNHSANGYRLPTEAE